MFDRYYKFKGATIYYRGAVIERRPDEVKCVTVRVTGDVGQIDAYTWSPSIGLPAEQDLLFYLTGSNYAYEFIERDEIPPAVLDVLEKEWVNFFKKLL